MDTTNLPGAMPRGLPPGGQMPPQEQEGEDGFGPEFEILEAIMSGGQVEDGSGNTLDFSVIPEEVRAKIQEAILSSDVGEGEEVGPEGPVGQDPIGDKIIGGM